MEKIAAENPKHVRMTQIGMSEGVILKETEYYFNYKIREKVPSKPIYALDFLPSGRPVGTIAIVAGHHATEDAGPASALVFLERLLKSNTPLAERIKREFQVVIIPVVDVDQYSLPFNERIYTMTNNFYHRINVDQSPAFYTDYAGYIKFLKAPSETRAIAQAIKDRTKVAPLVLSFDLHEAASYSATRHPKGFFLNIPAKNDRDDLVEAVDKRFGQSDLSIDPGFFERKSPRDPLSNFGDFSSSLGAIAFTQESPRLTRSRRGVVKSNIRVQMHIESMDAILERYFNTK